MPTDEQREQFDSWAQTQAWTFGGSSYDLAFAAWQAAWQTLDAEMEHLQDALKSQRIDLRLRDAEVQALREALTYALHVLECLKADNPNPLLPNARWRLVDMACAAFAGGEIGEEDE